MNEILINFILHVRDREYMSGVERDKLRVKQTAEVFTPTLLVQEMLDKLEEQDPTVFWRQHSSLPFGGCVPSRWRTGFWCLRHIASR